MQSSQRSTAEATRPNSSFVLVPSGAGLVGLVVEGEEALDAEMAAAEDLLVEVGAGLLKFVQTAGCRHKSSAKISRDLGGMGKAIIAQRAKDASVKFRELEEIA